MTVRFVIEAAAKNTVGSFVVGTQEVRIGRDYTVKTVDIEMLGTVSAMEKLFQPWRLSRKDTRVTLEP